MQGMIGCYIKNEKNYRNLTISSMKAMDKMLSVLGEDKNVNIKRNDFSKLSLAFLYNKRTPYNFKPEHLLVNDEHFFTDGFIRDKKSFLSSIINNHSDDILLSLNHYSGFYNIICYNETTNELKILNDRIGARYLYYYSDDDILLFAPNPKILLSSELIKNKEIDYQAIISLLSHEYIMGYNSLVKSIKLFPNASYIKFKYNHQESHQYWNFDSLSSLKHDDNYDNLIENGKELLKRAIESYAIKDAEAIIPLSGGLDSRTIACFLSGKVPCRALHVDYSFERKIANRISNQLGLDFEIQPLYKYQPWQSIDPFILCATHSIHQFWLYPFLREKIMQGFGTLIFDGLLMNEVLGGLSTISNETYSDINKRFPPLSKSFDFILGDKIKKSFYKDHDTQLVNIISNCPSDLDYDKFLYFTVLNYGRRFTLLFSVIHQNVASVGLPMLDYELMDFALKLPFEPKINSRFYRDIVTSAFPEIAKIPWSRNRLPLDSQKKVSATAYYHKKIKNLKYYLSRITKSKIEYIPRNNKNTRFRKDKKYRDYFTNIIFDERTFSKEYVTKAGLEKIVYLIDSGRNYFQYLEKVACIELITRELDVN